MKRYGIIFILFLCELALLVPHVVRAGEFPQYNIARTLAIEDAEAIDGDIVTFGIKAESLVRSAKSFDERMYGVLVENPIMVYRTLPTLAVTRQGDVYVNVTTLGGTIEVGDYVTSSPIAGKGQKAEGLAGYMLGVSMEAFDGNGATGSADFESKQYPMGQVKVSVGIGPASPIISKAAGGLLGTLKQIATAIMFNISTSKQAERVIRWILAILIVIVVIYISYRTFGRNVTKGIEAIGRNPLAKASIQAMITLNIVLLGITVIAAVGLALVLISL